VSAILNSKMAVVLLTTTGYGQFRIRQSEKQHKWPTLIFK